MTIEINEKLVSAMRDYLNSNMGRYMETLRAMVEINSFTENREGVDKLASLTASLFGPMGFISESIPSMHPGCGSHLVLARTGTSERTIGCVSHLDTVFTAAEEAMNGFTWRVDGDRVYGPGTNDIKGGTVVLYMTLDALSRFVPGLFNELTWLLLFDATEETESDDFGELCRSRLKSGGLAYLVFEGGEEEGNEYSLVTARKGRAVFRVSAGGKGAHAGTDHHSGVNAIVQMAAAVERIARLTDYKRELTFNIGTITGGTVINRVPHSCEAWVEMRAYSPDVFDEGLASMLALDGFSTLRSDDGTFAGSVKVELMRRNPAWPDNEGSRRLLDCFINAGKKNGIRVVPQARGGISDGNLVWHEIPTIDGLGPAGDNAHCSERLPDASKDQEYALLSSFVPKAVLSALGIVEIAGMSGQDTPVIYR